MHRAIDWILSVFAMGYLLMGFGVTGLKPETETSRLALLPAGFSMKATKFSISTHQQRLDTARSGSWPSDSGWDLFIDCNTTALKETRAHRLRHYEVVQGETQTSHPSHDALSPLARILDHHLVPGLVQNELATDLTFSQMDCGIDTSFTAVRLAQMTVPNQGSQLDGPDQDFAWRGNGLVVDEWQLLLGTKQSGSDLFNSGPLPSSATGQTATGLLLDGSDLFARLCYRLGGGWFQRNFLYTTSTYPKNRLSSILPLNQPFLVLQHSSLSPTTSALSTTGKFMRVLSLGLLITSSPAF